MAPGRAQAWHSGCDSEAWGFGILGLGMGRIRTYGKGIRGADSEVGD